MRHGARGERPRTLVWPISRLRRLTPYASHVTLLTWVHHSGNHHRLISIRRVTRHRAASHFAGRKPGVCRAADGPNGTIPPRPVHGDPEATPTVRRY